MYSNLNASLDNIYSLVDLLNDFDINSILSLIDTADGKIPIIALLSSLLLLALSVVLMLVRFGCLTMACSKHGKIRNYIFDIAMLAMCAGATALLMLIPDKPYFNIDFIDFFNQN